MVLPVQLKVEVEHARPIQCLQKNRMSHVNILMNNRTLINAD